LQAEGYTVISTANGREALEYLERAPPPRLILLDLAMPVMDGLQFLEEVRARAALTKIPVVLLSANSQLDRAAEALRVAGYLQKPVQQDRLLSIVGEHASGPRRAPQGWA
jgi:CheY-like chemotaxis protein